MKSMKTSAKAAKLVEYILSLPDFRIVEEIDGNYRHLGATIADAVLQANMRYETHVRGRISEIRARYPNAATLPGLIRTLEKVTPNDFMRWRGVDRAKRFKNIVDLLFSEGIKTENNLKHWLMDDKNPPKLRAIHGIGPKTVDYLRILTGIETAAIDRRLRNFLESAGLVSSGYDEDKSVVVAAANIMEISPAYLDHSIWRYKGANTDRPCKKMKRHLT